MDVVYPMRRLLAFSVPHVFDQEDANAEGCQKCKDAERYDEMLGFRGSKTPITAVMANLIDPNDPRR